MRCYTMRYRAIFSEKYATFTPFFPKNHAFLRILSTKNDGKYHKITKTDKKPIWNEPTKTQEKRPLPRK